MINYEEFSENIGKYAIYTKLGNYEATDVLEYTINGRIELLILLKSISSSDQVSCRFNTTGNSIDARAVELYMSPRTFQPKIQFHKLYS